LGGELVQAEALESGKSKVIVENARKFDGNGKTNSGAYDFKQRGHD